MDEFFAIYPDPEFPLADVQHIEKTLTATRALVPGYIPPSIGLLDIRAIRYAQEIEKRSLIILPDRNIVSRIAKIAEHGTQGPFDEPTMIAANLMAFCQCLDVDFDPSIAFHELAHRTGNESAHRELAWFRTADQPQAQAWVDLALGRRDQLILKKQSQLSTEDFALPLKRFTRNYLVALKIAELELSEATPVERVLYLFDWMYSEYFLAGPAAAFATMYFSPFATKKRLIKQLRSLDREKALAGIRNAAWDMTHLSDFARRIAEGEAEGRRYIFASADKNLVSIAPMLTLDTDENNLATAMQRHLLDWWPSADAAIVAEAFSSRSRAASGRPPPKGPPGINNPFATWTDIAERVIRDWKPT